MRSAQWPPCDAYQVQAAWLCCGGESAGSALCSYSVTWEMVIVTLFVGRAAILAGWAVLLSDAVDVI